MAAIPRLHLVVRAVAETARWAPTLSMDEPHAFSDEPMVSPKLFMASWWNRLALQAALDGPYPPPPATPHGHANCRCTVEPVDP